MSALQEQFAQDAAKLIAKAVELGFTVTMGEAWRTPQQAQWNADHGSGIAHSLHIERLAIDLNFFKAGAYVTDSSQIEEVGKWWESLGPNYRWGGRFQHLPDGNHFSLSPDGHIA
jgi:hypothetical protein